MLTYPHLDPVALNLGIFKIHWYGLMYLIGLTLAWALGHYRLKKNPGLWSPAMLDDLLFYGALGIIIGGRLGYVLFYDFSFFLHSPLAILKVWQGGMSFHGGLLGVLIALGLFAKHKHLPYFAVGDFVAPLVPLGLGAGRLGNFINGELWGRVTTVPWGMVFPEGGPFSRHPSQLYEAFFEGIALFVILWLYSRKPRSPGKVSGLFLLMYGFFRCMSELFRQPDIQWGYLWLNLTMGQLLSLPMIIGGLFIMIKSSTKNIN